MASGQVKFGPSTYTYETQKRKILVTINRGDIDNVKWAELPKVIEKINDDEECDILDILEINDKECRLKFTLDDVADHTDLQGWMEDVAYNLFDQSVTFDVSAIPSDLIYKKEELHEGMEIYVVEVRSSLTTRHIMFLPFKNEIDMHKNISLFDNYWVHGLTVTLDRNWIDKI